MNYLVRLIRGYATALVIFMVSFLVYMYFNYEKTISDVSINEVYSTIKSYSMGIVFFVFFIEAIIMFANNILNGQFYNTGVIEKNTYEENIKPYINESNIKKPTNHFMFKQYISKKINKYVSYLRLNILSVVLKLFIIIQSVRLIDVFIQNLHNTILGFLKIIIDRKVEPHDEIEKMFITLIILLLLPRLYKCIYIKINYYASQFYNLRLIAHLLVLSCMGAMNQTNIVFCLVIIIIILIALYIYEGVINKRTSYPYLEFSNDKSSMDKYVVDLRKLFNKLNINLNNYSYESMELVQIQCEKENCKSRGINKADEKYD